MLFLKFIILILFFCIIVYYSIYVSLGNTWDAHWEITCGKLRLVNHLKNGLRLEEGLMEGYPYNLAKKRYFVELWYIPVISKFDKSSVPFLIFKIKPFYINHYISLKFENKNKINSYSLFYKENITRHLLSKKAYKTISRFYSQKLFVNSLNSLNKNKESRPYIRTKTSYDAFFYSNFWNKHRSNCLYVDVSWLGYRVTFK